MSPKPPQNRPDTNNSGCSKRQANCTLINCRTVVKWEDYCIKTSVKWIAADCKHWSRTYGWVTSGVWKWASSSSRVVLLEDKNSTSSGCNYVPIYVIASILNLRGRKTELWFSPVPPEAIDLRVWKQREKKRHPYYTHTNPWDTARKSNTQKGAMW